MIAARYPQQLEAEGGPGAVIGSGESQLIPEITDAMLATWARDEKHLELLRALGVRSTCACPCGRVDRPWRADAVHGRERAPRFASTDLPLAEELGRRAAVAIQNAWLHESTCSRPRARPVRLLRSSTRSCRPRRSASRSTTTSSGSPHQRRARRDERRPCRGSTSAARPPTSCSTSGRRSRSGSARSSAPDCRSSTRRSAARRRRRLGGRATGSRATT